MKNKNERHNWYNGLNIRTHKSAIIDNVKYIIQLKLLNPRKFTVINSMKDGKAYGIFINDEDLPLTILSGNYVKEFRRDDPNYRTIRIMPSKISYSLEQYN